MGYSHITAPLAVSLCFVLLYALYPVSAQGAAITGPEVQLAQDKTRDETRAQMKEEKRLGWDEDAENTLGLGRGMGKKLMTEEEWREHQRKMQTMTKEEREKYREEVHKKMVERAKERGITLPEEPRPMKKMDGRGMGDGMGGGMGGRGR